LPCPDFCVSLVSGIAPSIPGGLEPIETAKECPSIFSTLGCIITKSSNFTALLENHAPFKTTIVYNYKMESGPPTKATDAVLVASAPIGEDAQPVRGIDWTNLPSEQRSTIASFVDQMASQGFQSSSIKDAIRIINEMVGGLSNMHGLDI
jgi:hypothetical protein